MPPPGCTQGDLESYGDAKHMVIQCHAYNVIREKMYNKLSEICNAFELCDFGVLMGKFIDGWDFKGSSQYGSHLANV